MRESIITASLSFFCGVLLIAAVVGIYLKDRTAPEITLEGKNTLVYVEGDDVDLLLKDVKAMDDEDGDVSDSLRVSDIYVTSEDRAMVIYVAKDQSNNIAKLKREVKYQSVTEEMAVTGEGTTAESSTQGTTATQNNGATASAANTAVTP